MAELHIAADRWLWPYRPVSLLPLLRALRSPVAAHLPAWADLLQAECLAHGLNPLWLLARAQLEQQFVEGPWGQPAGGALWERRLNWCLGMGAADSGDRPGFAGWQAQITRACARLRQYITPGDAVYAGRLIGTPVKCHDGVATPANLGTACLLQYTPDIAAARLFASIYGRYEKPAADYGGESMGIVQMKITSAEAAIAAEPPSRRIDEVVVHHTWSPTSAQYKGLATVEGIRAYHMGTRGWSDIGYHWLIAPDGTCYSGRPMSRSGAHTLGRNEHTAGVAAIANFDNEDPWAWGGMDELLRVVRALLTRYKLTAANVRFHREFADKSCPGDRLNLARFRQAVDGVAVEPTQREDAEDMQIKIVILPGHEHVVQGVLSHDGTEAWWPVRASLAALQAAGCLAAPLEPVPDHIATQGKVYVRRVPE